jgi:hypothetical protein
LLLFLLLLAFLLVGFPADVDSLLLLVSCWRTAVANFSAVAVTLTVLYYKKTFYIIGLSDYCLSAHGINLGNYRTID